MKKRNLVIVAFMLVAAMTIGVGYAALSVELTLTGNAVYDVEGAQEDFESDVYFASGEVVTEDTTGSGSTADSIGEITTGAHAVTFNVMSPIYAGEKAVFEFVVKNDSATEVYLTWDKTQWVSTNYTLEFSENVTSIAANSEATVRVVATLETVPNADLEETFILTADVSDVAAP